VTLSSRCSHLSFKRETEQEGRFPVEANEEKDAEKSWPSLRWGARDAEWRSKC